MDHSCGAPLIKPHWFQVGLIDGGRSIIIEDLDRGGQVVVQGVCRPGALLCPSMVILNRSSDKIVVWRSADCTVILTGRCGGAIEVDGESNVKVFLRFGAAVLYVSGHLHIWTNVTVSRYLVTICGPVVVYAGGQGVVDSCHDGAVIHACDTARVAGRAKEVHINGGASCDMDADSRCAVYLFGVRLL